MTEKSIMWTTDGTGDGATDYTMAELTRWLRQTYLSDNTDEGVLKNYGGALAVSGTTSPVDIASGGALVYGFPYWNTAATTMAIPTPSGDTRIDRVVLSADWTTQTVRLERVAGAEGGAAPALTQTDGVEWQISLAQASITTGGAITVTDERVYVHPNWEIELAQTGTDLDGDGIQGGDSTAFAVDVSDFAGAGLQDDGSENIDVVPDDTTIELSGGDLQVKAEGLNALHISNITRRFLVQASEAYNSTAGASCARNVRGWELADNALCYAYGSFSFPADGTSMSVYAVYNAPGAGTANLYEADGYYSAADGEAYDTAGSGLGSYLAYEKDRDDKWEISSLYTISGTHGDRVVLIYARDATNAIDTMNGIVYFIGFLVEYTATR